MASRIVRFFSLAVLAPAISAMLLGSSIAAPNPGSEGTEITVYNQNFALVKDQRMIDLEKGVNTIRFTDVAAQIDPTSVHFKSLTAPNSVAILEQNYQYDLISPDKVLQKYVGQEITVRRQVDGTEKVIRGNLLSTEGGITLQTPDGIVLNPPGTVELPKLPEGLISKPTLLWMLDSTQAGTHRTEISYMTSGLNWKADYVAVVNKTDDKVDLSGWVTLDNKSGATYKDANLKLIAGDVHRVQDQTIVTREMGVYGAVAAPAAPPQFQEKSFFEYHMYTLGRKTDLSDNETKQLSLLTASDVPAKKVFVYDGGRSYWYGGDTSAQQKVRVMMEINNSKENHLGMPLPKGKIRVYKQDDDGAEQFVGEDQIDHTPKDEKVRLYLGDAFDLVGERKRMDFKKISDRVQEETFEISLRNHKDTAVTINVVEHLASDWKVLESNFDYVKKDAHTIEFPIKVGPNGSQTLTYRVRTQW